MAAVPTRRATAAGLLTIALSLPLLGGIAAAAPADPTPTPGAAVATPFAGGRAIVQGSGDMAAAEAAVRGAGGTVLDELPIVSGVAADLPAGAVLPGFTVAADRPMTVAAAPAPEAPAATDPAPASTDRATMGLGASTANGHGVTVAVVDTGVADVPDLAGRVLHVDVSGTRPSIGPGADGYGHGTFVAGLVAGSGEASKGAYRGAAPDAALLDVRVAADDGSTSLVSVLRGLQVVAASADRLDIRVLNLSLSSGSPLPYQLDPLTQALEALWRSGVTVVVPAGNDGPSPGTLGSPGVDPTLLTVGALDEAGTAARDDDTVAPYSSRGGAGSQAGKPDLVAPGSHLISLRAPGSQVDSENPGSRIGSDYFRGSGTSMSTALMSGVVADLMAARPGLSPDQVKAMLTGTAYPSAGLTDPTAAGAGGVDAAAALAAPAPTVAPAPETNSMPPGSPQVWEQFSRAMMDGNRDEANKWWNKLSPEARSWVGRSWVALDPAARSWVARSWVGRSWVGDDGTADEWLARSWVARSWVARSWVGRSWVGRSWVGRSWIDEAWAGRSWVGRSWVGRSWVDDDWAGRSWVGRSWVGRSWVGRSWVDDQWDGRSWVGRSWVDDEWDGRSWVGDTWAARSWTEVSWS